MSIRQHLKRLERIQARIAEIGDEKLAARARYKELQVRIWANSEDPLDYIFGPESPSSEPKPDPLTPEEQAEFDELERALIPGGPDSNGRMNN
jgi:hypothetical protein